ncbi:TspO/MBR family protein [Aquimarina agarilytica]|uniref:TspO/MBR family protein n=1 Tax=Aquimarina agarilytica TaxID=1087449 RepID=UPI0002886C17|nr:TspO/MBR family protein [Aquimarina agarilytica]
MNKKIIKIIIAVTVCLVAGVIGAAATQTSVNTWYTTLSKPSFNPPNYVFGPVWTILYILMGISAGKIWNHGFYHKWVKTALYHFGFQLILNITWSLVFFGLNEIFGALLIIIGLLVLLLFTYKWFKIVNTNAAYLLIPYILWVSFASVLNFSIWQLN